MECASTVALTASIMFTFIGIPMLITIWRLKEENKLFREHQEVETTHSMIYNAVIIEVAKAMKAYQDKECADEIKKTIYEEVKAHMERARQKECSYE